MKPKSIIIPVFNEEEMIPLVYEGLVFYLESKDELIFINDGSTDRTIDELKKLITKDNRIKIVNFSRNFGQQAAITAGLQYSSGDCVIIMDCDLQDPPELIPSLVEKWEEGYDIVLCIRKKRLESLYKKISYKIFYWLYTLLTEFPSQADSGDFSLMSRRVVDEINSLSETAKFIRGLRAFLGFKHTSIEYDRPARYKGGPKYNLRKLINLGLDGLFSFTTFPIRLMSILGFILLLISILIILFILYKKIFSDMIIGTALTYILILFFGGINLLCFGIIGEYIGRIFYETKKRPSYVVESCFNIDSGFDKK